MEYSIEYKIFLIIYWSWGNVMENIFKIFLFLIILVFEDVNGRLLKKGIKDGKFVYSKLFVFEKWYIMWVYFVC